MCVNMAYLDSIYKIGEEVNELKRFHFHVPNFSCLGNLNLTRRWRGGWDQSVSIVKCEIRYKEEGVKDICLV